MTNRAILTQIGNRRKSATAAKDYLAIVKTGFPNALKLQCVPEDPELWDISRYEDFLQARREILATKLNEFLANLTEISTDIAAPATLEEIISEGESDELEFKATFRWDTREGNVNKSLQDAIVKTVAAFANAEGGTLLIGVDNNGQIVGLEHDYASMNGDKDKFELAVRTALANSLSEAFVARKVGISFPTVGDREICQVEVDAASEPVIFDVISSNGQKSEKFYVRSGNSSQEIPLRQVSSYFKDRFN
jgi:hypothetical protein